MTNSKTLVGSDEVTPKSDVIEEIEQIFEDDPTLESWIERPWQAFEKGGRTGGTKLPRRAWNTLRAVQADNGGSRSIRDLLELKELLRKLTFINCPPAPKSPGRSKAAQKRAANRRKAAKAEQKDSTDAPTNRRRRRGPASDKEKSFVKIGKPNAQGVPGQPQKRGGPVAGAGTSAKKRGK